MREAFLEILNNYIQMYNSSYKPTQYELASTIIKTVPKILIEQTPIDSNKYKVEGSVGAGRWTDTPWICIFDRDITESAQIGFYIVYLFKRDMSGVYLSLNQGTTYIKNKYKGKNPRNKMKIVASALRELLNYDVELFPEIDIDLCATTDNAKNYMAAHICGKYYPSTKLPNTDDMLSDLRKLMDVYSQLKKIMGTKSPEEFFDSLLYQDLIEDTHFQNDVLTATPAQTPLQPQSVPKQTQSTGRNVWKRNPSVAKEALEKANYRCEINPEHKTFISEVTGKNFVEAHHLVPMNLQSKFSWSLDVPGNIVSLCPNCHRQIHHATVQEKRKIIKNLYEKRVSLLKAFGIIISFEELLDSYIKKY
jgi:5-methylcytosine-specific restriction protein A